MSGRARDLVTVRDDATWVVGEGSYEILASPQREILQIRVSPERAVQSLVGKRGGGRMRSFLIECLAEDAAATTPLFHLLDDFSGASLVSGWAWSRWIDNWLERTRESGINKIAGKSGVMTGVCAGFRPGSAALKADGTVQHNDQMTGEVRPLVHPDDPVGWHVLDEQRSVAMRRARRLDLWREDDSLRLDAGFQDSATTPAGGRAGVHEYSIVAKADCASQTLTEISVVAHLLPYNECLGAPPNAQLMLGAPLSRLRTAVPDVLSGTLGCTHLNDVLRTLADAPALYRALQCYET